MPSTITLRKPDPKYLAQIESLCLNFEGNEKYCLAEIHRLHTESRQGILGAEPLDVLHAISNSSSGIEGILKIHGQRSDPALSSALISLAKDIDYAKNIIKKYNEEILPLFNLPACYGFSGKHF